jgi:glyoxylase-like metal-dependent hydrolase (beta-lactamase superfamily II)
LKEQLGSSVQVLMPELDARIHDGEKVVDGKLPGSWPKLETKPDVRLSAGDRVGSLEVVSCPGHSPGHVAFLDTRDRTLLAGDVYTTYGSTAVTSHFYARFPFAAMATWDKRRDVESARVLRALDPPIIVVGHGPPVRDPAAAMDAALARAVSRLPKDG